MGEGSTLASRVREQSPRNPTGKILPFPPLTPAPRADSYVTDVVPLRIVKCSARCSVTGAGPLRNW